MRRIVPLLVLALVLAACGGGSAATEPEAETGGSMQEERVQETPAPAATETSEPVAQPSPTGEATEVAVASEPMAEEEATTVSVPEPTAPPEPTATMEPTTEPAPVAENLPVYLSSELVDVNSGESFRVADLTGAGNYVLLEMMAVWCTNCRQQQEQVKAYEATGPANVVSVALDIDLNESQELLREHATRNGFDWHYAIATQEVARQIGADFGQQFLTPPSVPMLLIRPDNSVVAFPFGIKSADELAAFVESNRLE
jgi:thiol-disulfide isomerase/thioredoxin